MPQSLVRLLCLTMGLELSIKVGGLTSGYYIPHLPDSLVASISVACGRALEPLYPYLTGGGFDLCEPSTNRYSYCEFHGYYGCIMLRKMAFSAPFLIFQLLFLLSTIFLQYSQALKGWNKYLVEG